jgi:type II secretory pathway pseudopilin PulG
MPKFSVRRSALSVVELIIAIVILGLLAALAIPRFSRASQNTPEDELRHRLSVLRTAIELYHADHDGYPGTIDGQPATDAADLFAAQLTRRTTADGRLCESGSAACHGPYIRDGLPRSPFRRGGGPGRVSVSSATIEAHADALIDADWLFDCRTGYLFVNDPGADGEGKRFDQY